jgi:hypothetical protein
MRGSTRGSRGSRGGRCSVPSALAPRSGRVLTGGACGRVLGPRCARRSLRSSARGLRVERSDEERAAAAAAAIACGRRPVESFGRRDLDRLLEKALDVGEITLLVGATNEIAFARRAGATRATDSVM